MNARAPWLWMLLAVGCASTSTGPLSPPLALAPRARPAPPPPPPEPEPVPLQLDGDPSLVVQGELPWWYALKPGLYKYGERIEVMATGRSIAHHHVVEGFVQSKVTARLGVRKAAAMVAFPGNLPEPVLVDLFITRDRKFLALYGLEVPAEARPAQVAELVLPEALQGQGRRRIGRHVYEGNRHLFLECEIEGPIANPDWGRTRAAAFLYVPSAESHRP